MIKVLSLFSGIGAFEKALSREGIAHEVVNYCEIDKYASKAYAAVHGVSEDKNLKDVCSVDGSKYQGIDLLTYGFPCTDISQAGQQKGFVDETGAVTRSGLFFEALRIIMGAKPRVAIAENVKALTSKKFANEFATVLRGLEMAGYNNYYKVLNAKDFGVPQNRERVFIVSIRKDIDTYSFKFPEGFPLIKRLKDILLPQVEEKFYLSDEQIENITSSTYFQNKRRIQDKDWSDTLCARDWKDPKCVKVGNVNPSGHGQNGTVVSADGLARAVTTEKGEGQKIFISDCNTQIVDMPCIAASRGRNPDNPSDRTVGAHTQQRLEVNSQGLSNTITTVQKDNYVLEPRVQQIGNFMQKDTGFTNPQCGHVYSPDGLSPTLNTMQGGNREPKIVEPNVSVHPFSKKLEFDGFHTDNSPCLLATDYKAPKCTLTPDYRIRKLTPLECWRLMGFDDNDFYKARNTGISNSQLYKQAGNSIVVDVLQHIFRELYKVHTND